MTSESQEWFDEGIFAFSAGMGFLDNPYLETDITKARIWIDGFVSAFIAHRELANRKSGLAESRHGERV